MIPKCICEGDFDGEQTHRSNPKAICPVHDDCEYCGEAKAVASLEGDKVCKTCLDACTDFNALVEESLEEESV